MNLTIVFVLVVSKVMGTSLTSVNVCVLCFVRTEVDTEVTGIVSVIDAETLKTDRFVIVIKSVIVVCLVLNLVTV